MVEIHACHGPQAIDGHLRYKERHPALVGALLQQCAILLSAYHYNKQFKPTKEHTNVGGLSRLLLKNEQPVQLSDFQHWSVFALSITVQQIERTTHYDPVLNKVLMFTKKGWPAKTEEVFKPFSK